jgi:hypothetical protein
MNNEIISIIRRYNHTYSLTLLLDDSDDEECLFILLHYTLLNLPKKDQKAKAMFKITKSVLIQLAKSLEDLINKLIQELEEINYELDTSMPPTPPKNDFKLKPLPGLSSSFCL